MRMFEYELPNTYTGPGLSEVKWLRLDICPTCGWWHFQRDHALDLESNPGKPIRSTWWELTHAVQTEIDLGSDTLPLDHLQLHLMRRWEDRRLISAQQAEDLVASLLKEHHGGQVVRLTANANAADGGIDLYLSTRDDGFVQRAVQVKRRITTDVESVKEVRNFVGAMVLTGADEGIFVTTATRFSKDARAVSRKAHDAKFKLRLDLIDGEQLLEMMYATAEKKTVLIPPLVALDQEWRDVNGRRVLARDLFFGDLERQLRR
jgi:hypothetical protein